MTDDLLRPEAYGPLGPTRVERVETHASRVYLLDRDVFKTKRPVDLGFLDYSTLAKREAACGPRCGSTRAWPRTSTAASWPCAGARRPRDPRR